MLAGNTALPKFSLYPSHADTSVYLVSECFESQDEDNFYHAAKVDMVKYKALVTL